MNPVVKSEVLDLARYELAREEFRRLVFAAKRIRRLAVGPSITLTFENHLTVLFQIQEMIRTERIVKDAAIQAELDVYNELIPPPWALSATLFIEFTHEGTIREDLRRLIGIDRETWLVLPGCGRVPAEFEPGRQTELKLASVQYIRFQLTPIQAEELRAGGGEVQVHIAHPGYDHRVGVPPALRDELTRDLFGE